MILFLLIATISLILAVAYLLIVTHVIGQDCDKYERLLAKITPSNPRSQVIYPVSVANSYGDESIDLASWSAIFRETMPLNERLDALYKYLGVSYAEASNLHIPAGVAPVVPTAPPENLCTESVLLAEYKPEYTARAARSRRRNK